MEEKNSEKKERKMRDSGIPWIREVPEGWGVNKIKYHLTRNEIKNKPDKQVLSVYRDYGVIPKDSRDDNHNVTSEDTSKYKYVQKGDLVINKMKAWQGSLGVSKYEGIVSPAYYIYKFHDDSFDGKFFHYLIRGCYKDEFRRISGGIREGQWDLSAEKFENTMIIIPPVSEQHRIADFIDSKCSEIDTLIENLRARMESAKEYKKAVITEAVTKGLDKDAKMKDSGVEWIGEIPEEWKTPKLKNVAILTNGDRGKNYPSGNDLVDDGICFFTANNIHEQYLDCSSDKNKFITESRYNILGGAKIKLNDILFCLRGSTAGNAAINKTVNAGTIASSLVCITPQYINPDYLNYYLQSEMNAIQTSLFMNGSCAANLSAENVLNYYIIQPSTLEQQQIVSYLDSKCFEIDALLQNYENQIATLEEYKKSLIYEYVTGKKEVPAA